MSFSQSELAVRRRDAIQRRKNSRAMANAKDGDEVWIEGKRYWYWRGTWRDWK